MNVIKNTFPRLYSYMRWCAINNFEKKNTSPYLGLKKDFVRIIYSTK